MKKRLLSILLAICFVLSLLPVAVFSADTPTYPNTITVAGKILSGYDYLYYKNGSLTTINSTLPDVNITDNYVYYNIRTGTLTFKNFTTTVSDSTYGMFVAADGTTYTDLNIEVIGTNSVTVNGSAGGFYLQNTYCSFSGTGSLNVTCNNMSALSVRSLTVNSAATLYFKTNSTSSSQAIESVKGITVSAGNITALATSGTIATGIGCNYDNFTISNTAKITAEGSSQGINVSRGALNISGNAEVNVSALEYDAVWTNTADISGSPKVKLSSAKSGGLGANGDVSVSLSNNENSSFTANCKGVALYSFSGKIVLGGGNITLNSSGSNSVWTDTGTISVSGGNIFAKSYYPAFFADKGITVSGGDLTAVASSGSALQSYTGENGTGKVEITGGTVAVASTNPTYYSITANSLTVNGDAIVYGKNYYPTPTVTKGIVYKSTAVSIEGNDTANSAKLSGGVGTVYGNPNVSEFTKPTDSVLGTVFDEFVTVTANDTAYTGSVVTPQITVKVQKTALNKPLANQTDYTVDSNSSTAEIGEKIYKIAAVSNSGNLGNKEFNFNVVSKQLNWNTSSVIVKNVESEDLTRLELSGNLGVSGAVNGENVVLKYTSLTPIGLEKQGDSYYITLSVTGAELGGTHCANYSLPSDNPIVTVTLNQDNSDSAPPKTDTPASPSKPDQPSKPSDKVTEKSPKTGYGNIQLLWIGLLVISGGAFTTLKLYKKGKDF